MAQAKNRIPLQSSKSEEPAASVMTVVPVERDLPHMRFAFGVWVVVFSILAASIVWDSIYGLLFRTQSGG